MEPTPDPGQPASPDHPLDWLGWTTADRIGQVGQPGIVIDEAGGRRDLWCYDPAQPIVTDRNPDWLGYAGAPFALTFADGQVVVTNNLTHLGEIPPSLHDQVPVNAVVARLQTGDTYELSHAGDTGHNLRRVTTSPTDALSLASRMSGTGDQVDVAHIQGNGRRAVIASFAGGGALPQDQPRNGLQDGSGAGPPRAARPGQATGGS